MFKQNAMLNYNKMSAMGLHRETCVGGFFMATVEQPYGRLFI